MEEIVNGRCKLPADAVHFFEVGDACATYRFCRSECHKQGFFAPRANAWNFVERIDANRFRAPGAMRSNGKTMGFIPEPLDIVQDGIAGIEHEGRLARNIEMLPAGITVQPLGDADDGEAMKAQILEHGPNRRDLALAAVDQYEVGAKL